MGRTCQQHGAGDGLQGGPGLVTYLPGRPGTTGVALPCAVLRQGVLSTKGVLGGPPSTASRKGTPGAPLPHTTPHKGTLVAGLLNMGALPPKHTGGFHLPPQESPQSPPPEVTAQPRASPVPPPPALTSQPPFPPPGLTSPKDPAVLTPGPPPRRSAQARGGSGACALRRRVRRAGPQPRFKFYWSLRADWRQ